MLHYNAGDDNYDV